MPASKIQDETELRRWIAEGKTYEWMSQEYLRKYNIETNPTMFSNFRRRRGLDNRNVRDEELIPWRVRPEHRHAWAVIMLRTEARRRAHGNVGPQETVRLEAWTRGLREDDAVVHYDPDTDEGFHLVPRRPGKDLDLIRDPRVSDDDPTP